MKEWTELLDRVYKIIAIAVFVSTAILVVTILELYSLLPQKDFQTPGLTEGPIPAGPTPAGWKGPDTSVLSDDVTRDDVAYGRDLVAHTAKYLGPEGSVVKISNGMNCQNCHLDAGTKPFGNNYALVGSSYPKFRARSGMVETLNKRVNDCFERSLNGTALDTASRELKSIVSYIKWVGQGIEKGSSHQEGVGLAALPFLHRAADPVAGQVAYESTCQTCHGRNGEGMKLPGQAEYQFPPLWGPHSYNKGAGLYRISNFARYVYANMPLGASAESPLLTPEQSWDIAAYVNSMPRPDKDLSADWPDISEKPVDHPFGPFADSFSEEQHKYGPFQPIKDFHATRK
jgi:thiosulfate dehydrogenase